MKRKSLIAALAAIGMILGTSAAQADDGDAVEERLDRKGDRIDRRLDRKGDRIDRRLDRRGKRLGNHARNR